MCIARAQRFALAYSPGRSDWTNETGDGYVSVNNSGFKGYGWSVEPYVQLQSYDDPEAK